MSRIVIPAGGLALFIGAVIGLLMGKGSWLLAIVGLSCFLWGMNAFWTRYSAARNAWLAKYTFDNLESGDARERVTEQVKELTGKGLLEIMATFSYPQMYGFYALAMVSLGMPPAIPGEKWFAARNPYRALLDADPEIASARHYFEKKYGILINFTNFDE